MVFSFSKLSEIQIKSIKPPTIKVITAPSSPELIGNVINKMNLQSMHSQKKFSQISMIFKMENLSQIKKLRLFIDLVTLQVCFWPFFFKDFEQQHIHCLIYLKL